MDGGEVALTYFMRSIVREGDSPSLWGDLQRRERLHFSLCRSCPTARAREPDEVLLSSWLRIHCPTDATDPAGHRATRSSSADIV